MGIAPEGEGKKKKNMVNRKQNILEMSDTCLFYAKVVHKDNAFYEKIYKDNGRAANSPFSNIMWWSAEHKPWGMNNAVDIQSILAVLFGQS